MRIFHKCSHDVQLYSMWCRGHVILFVILLLLLLLLFMMYQAEVKRSNPKLFQHDVNNIPKNNHFHCDMCK